jgi:transcriptional regulator with XRE-family HTH domain
VLEVKRLRQAREWNQTELAYHAGLAPSVISQIENGKRDPSARTLRKLAEALNVEVGDLFPKAQSSSPEPSFDDVLDDERRAAWEAAVDEARRLREPGRARRMWRAVIDWRASKQRGEPDADRRKYLDEMGNLLQEAYGAYTTLGNAYIQAALTQGGSEASVPSYLREETQAANDFYVEMFGMVKSAGLTIHRGDEATAAKRAAEASSGGREHSVQEAG